MQATISTTTTTATTTATVVYSAIAEHYRPAAERLEKAINRDLQQMLQGTYKYAMGHALALLSTREAEYLSLKTGVNSDTTISKEMIMALASAMVTDPLLWGSDVRSLKRAYKDMLALFLKAQGQGIQPLPLKDGVTLASAIKALRKAPALPKF